MKSMPAGRLLAACALTAGAVCVTAPSASAINGDTHITGVGLVETIECNNATVFVNGANNQVNVLGNCWAVTVQGSYNTVVADHVTNDITVYGFNQTVLYKGGEPIVWDRGRELGMTNTINRVPA
ncbi:DUF3060 domain-containing protein [Mycolicibacterium vaccae]|uniref:DUF3060 domain-containing protein n=1 Tax=Mycolicibacterium vaccae TaxID=1810 RepID=UPI003CFB8D81